MLPCPFCSRMEEFHVRGCVQKTPWNVQYISFLPASALDEAILKCLLHSDAQRKPHESPRLSWDPPVRMTSPSPCASTSPHLHLPQRLLAATVATVGDKQGPIRAIANVSVVTVHQALCCSFFVHSPMSSSYLLPETRAVNTPTLEIRKQLCRKAKTLSQSCPVSKWQSWVSNPWPV